MGESITKTVLLDRIQTAWNLLVELITDLDDARLIVPLLDNTWSIKDTLAHISAWEQAMVIWLGNAVRGETPSWPEGEFNQEKVDQINAEFYKQNRDKSLQQVLEAFHASHQATLDTLKAASDEILLEPGRVEWLGDMPFWQIVADNTYVHYKDHLENIQARLNLE